MSLAMTILFLPKQIWLCPCYMAWPIQKIEPGLARVFEYDTRYHNVLQVGSRDFHSCNSASVIATFSAGNDSITINSSGHYYSICGLTCHCDAGQKVDIRVLKPTGSPIEPPNNLVGSLNGPMASSPFQKSVKSLRNIGLMLITLGLCVNGFI
ncbi:Cupredoxin superfamily protein [Abeliophyllum distichum]|uniref:Cupredoxin superfamily protein n=1 Tax=Abeliophyllum distichum TaxID=126358 RepID=A0ABD1NQ69_9LAMI